MLKKKLLKAVAMVTITSTLLGATVGTFAGEIKITPVPQALANKSEDEKIAKAKETVEKKLKDTNSLEYLLVNNGNSLTYEDLVTIQKSTASKKLTDDTIKRMMVDKIKDKLQEPNVGIRAAANMYPIFGRNLTREELIIAAAYPSQALTASSDAKTAETTASSLYQAYTLYQGNGDAFRHAYWNSLMAKSIGVSLATAFANAHESETPNGIDKTMDLNNNNTGRNVTYYNPSYNPTQLKDTVILYVNYGYLNRIISKAPYAPYLGKTDASGRR